MPRAKLGHAHLLVRNIEISTEFYTSVLGLRVTEFEPDKWAFLTSGDLHHELALSQLGMEAPGPEEGRVGLFHLAFDVDSKADFAKIVNILIDRGIDLEPVDHRIGWGAYFSDPDGNCIPAPYRERLHLKNQVLIPVSCSSRQIGTNPWTLITLAWNRLAIRSTQPLAVTTGSEGVSRAEVSLAGEGGLGWEFVEDQGIGEQVDGFVALYQANSWMDFLSSLKPLIGQFLARFEEIASAGPAEDQEILKSMIAHENSFVHWIEKEMAEEEGALDVAISQLQYPLTAP